MKLMTYFLKDEEQLAIRKLLAAMSSVFIVIVVNGNIPHTLIKKL
jgi:hypothetical protein